jgi:hypothetical protein
MATAATIALTPRSRARSWASATRPLGMPLTRFGGARDESGAVRFDA